MQSRTPHGVRGLKYGKSPISLKLISRTPHGVRGLKYYPSPTYRLDIGSHPSRGAWIEMRTTRRVLSVASRRTPHGVRGLKCAPRCGPSCTCSRTPHGVRGLK